MHLGGLARRADDRRRAIELPPAQRGPPPPAGARGRLRAAARRVREECQDGALQGDKRARPHLPAECGDQSAGPPGGARGNAHDARRPALPLHAGRSGREDPGCWRRGWRGHHGRPVRGAGSPGLPRHMPALRFCIHAEETKDQRHAAAAGGPQSHHPAHAREVGDVLCSNVQCMCAQCTHAR